MSIKIKLKSEGTNFFTEDGKVYISSPPEYLIVFFPLSLKIKCSTLYKTSSYKKFIKQSCWPFLICMLMILPRSHFTSKKLYTVARDLQRYLSSSVSFSSSFTTYLLSDRNLLAPKSPLKRYFSICPYNCLTQSSLFTISHSSSLWRFPSKTTNNTEVIYTA